ncbi:CoA transferase [Sediminicoccus sp. BL-A-41-H5]|uniref:CoA transferase n=1 Tax=Sediminicoccus sp. BL-A-41-H5 TaxID=3421106 RepID=UPI003D6777A7
MSTLSDLLAGAGLEPGLTAQADLTGADPALPSSFRIGEAAQASIAALGLAVASLHAARGGAMQRVAVAMDDAAAEFHSERYLRIGDTPPADPWDAIAGAYGTADGGVVRLHTNFPHHRDGILKLLGCAYDRAAVTEALARRKAIAFETEATAAGLCVSAMRSFAEWDAHPQAQHLATTPLLTIERIGDASPRPLPAVANRPLEGFRVLDLTRVIAGPVAARGLAVHGAEVLHITGPHLPSIPTLVVDTGRGKRCATLDLRDAGDAARLDGLAAGADAFVQSYRAGALAAKGFSAEALAARHPGIVVGELCAYGWGGPWANKRGFDSLVQTSTGFNVAEAEAAGVAAPKVLPCQPLDHASGYLLALGVVAAWHRRAVEGGSWRVRVTLARTGLWLRSLGRIEGFGAVPHAPSLVAEEGPFGVVRHLPHSARMSLTPAVWSRPAEPLGASLPAWA